MSDKLPYHITDKAPEGVVYVSARGDDNNDGRTPETPVFSMQMAWNLAARRGSFPWLIPGTP